ncbi:MAG: peptide deformylase [FCB group bacterium]|jgi:peptide deformylase|nr:peptide deformylase [FCB group bacterium]
MAILNLTLYPDDPLKLVATPYEQVGPAMPQLARDMIETMYAHDGVGLAGPQVGLNKRIFVLHNPDTDEPMCLVNPEIIERTGKEEGEEGCLSIPTVYAPVPRATRIKIRALDPQGGTMEFEAHDFLARILQHEYDHLDGIVFLDRLDILTRQAKLQEWEEARARLMGSLQGS